MEKIAEHERSLLRYALTGLKEVPGITIYGESEPERAAQEKVGVITFNLQGISHFLVSAILGYLIDFLRFIEWFYFIRLSSSARTPSS